eukprot:TRINITY_DN2831_c0_g1_i1.p1 TRINITY_DN2831_c0_g1~~TRINITY_DN2831_c0_g1_i1.p1  ORF type:complete len:694 (-),score=222.17 TRINITY_DN2831_c0_g1_i1:74-2101(-)
MADNCGVPNPLGALGANILGVQQHIQDSREYEAQKGQGGQFLPPMHGSELMHQPHGPEMGQFAPHHPGMPLMPDVMMPPPHMVDMHHPHHMDPSMDSMINDFQQFHMHGGHAPPPDFEQIYHQNQFHHPPPENWAGEFMHPPPMSVFAQPHNMAAEFSQHPLEAAALVNQQESELDEAYREAAGETMWGDELQDMKELDEYFESVDRQIEDGEFEDAYNDAAGQADWTNEYLQQQRDSVDVDKNLVDRLMDGDPKLKNSKFMQFLSKISTGEVSFENNSVVERPALSAEEREFEDLYGDAQQQSAPISGEWVDEFKGEAVEAVDQAERWADDYEDQDYADDTYNLDDEEGELPEWVEQYRNFDWTNAMLNAKYGPPRQQADPVYQFAQNNPYIDHEDAFQEAMRNFEAGDLSEAILAFEAVVQKNPENADCWRLLGQCHAENEEETSAIASLLKAVELDPYNLEALLLLSVSYTNDFEQPRALNFLKAWLENHPDYQAIPQDDDVRQFQDLYSEGGNQHENVTYMFLKASQAMPHDSDVLVALGVLYNISSEYAKAVDCFQRAVELKPSDPTVWNKLGATLANSERSAEAVHAYQKALELRPNYVRALANLGISFANQGMHDRAVVTYLGTLARNPKAEHVWSYLRLSLSHMNRDDLVQLAHEKNVDAFRPHFQF